MNAGRLPSAIEATSPSVKDAATLRLIDTTMFFCPYGGGVKRYLKAKQAWFARFPHVRHRLLVPPQSNPTAHAIECRSVQIPLPGGYRLPLDVRCWRDQLIALQPDMIEAGDPYVPGWATLHAAQRLGIPAVAFFHSNMPRMLEQRVGSWIRQVARRYLKIFYREFDSVLAPSQTMLGELQSWGIDHASLQPMGVDTETFHPAKRDPALREQLALATETRLLVYAGRFAPEKNLDVLAAAVKRLGRPYHLLLVGGEKPERRANHVTILPYEADSSRVAALLASADAFVHAGDQETFGLVALEAMACGLPAVVVKGGALPELIDDSAGVTAERTTAADMADAIAALFTRDLQHVGIAARQRVLARYSWNSAFTQLTRHYAHLLDRPSLVYGALSHASG